MAKTTYGFASPVGIDTGIIRLGGAGLANLLFSWARCAVFCKANGAVQIYTTWPQIKRRCWTHWEPDKRHYCGLFRPLPDEVSGNAKMRLLYSLPRVEEADCEATSLTVGRIVVFRGLGRYFLDIPKKEHAWVRERFSSMLKNKQLLREKREPHIGIHIRLGDKATYQSRTANPIDMQLPPMSWYTHVINSISSELNWTGEVGVCSDGSDADLRPVLEIPGVRLVRGRTALDDFMYLAESDLLVGSSSTFSQWAAYISDGPSIWYPRFDRKGGLGNGSVEMTISEDHPPDRAEWRRCMDDVCNAKGSGEMTRPGQ